jgi:hypothetical protein
MVLFSRSGRRGGVERVDREGPLVRLREGEGKRRASLLRDEPHSGEDLALFSMRHLIALKHEPAFDKIEICTATDE